MYIAQEITGRKESYKPAVPPDFFKSEVPRDYQKSLYLYFNLDFL